MDKLAGTMSDIGARFESLGAEIVDTASFRKSTTT
jgi:hypothetical protein